MTDIPGLRPQKDKKLACINFHEIAQRLKSAREATERIWTPPVEKEQQILQTRAYALAQVSSSAVADNDSIEVLEFMLANEHYAVETHYVLQVTLLEHLTRLPCTPAFVLGIVNLRGAILPVISIKNFFELPEQGLTDTNKIIVLQLEKIRFCILVDEIVNVRYILLAGLQPPLPTLTSIQKDYLKGVTADRMALLDAEKLLNAENIVVQEQIAD
ncbi:chemotaxis protein CheW [Nitrosovibrio sp. Nv4]|uniref:chemotaxis protein CheW n=1 Tax=Nitrosovibrio sp. Nv4 TaxID=1945880 RepID=UPI000BC3C640|nr:chemotaxis protein CheW [Nitrosovibrio sp. Nv4]SOD41094.1 CheW protein [Nitrosovibrio sp. Nv4]